MTKCSNELQSMKKGFVRDLAHTKKMSKKTDIHGFEHIELPAKLLDYFLRSNKSNINQSIQVVGLCFLKNKVPHMIAVNVDYI